MHVKYMYFTYKLNAFSNHANTWKVHVEYMQNTCTGKKLAEDCPNIERLTVSNMDQDCKSEILNADVAIILENLKHLKKLKFCELVNNWRTYSIHNQTFRLLLERESHKPTKLSITNYFNNVHTQAIEKIVEEFTVNEVVIIPDPDEEDEQVIPDSDEDDW